MSRYVVTSDFDSSEQEKQNSGSFDIVSSYDKTTRKSQNEWSVKSIFQLLKTIQTLELKLNSISKKHNKFEKDFNGATKLLDEIKVTNISNSTKLNWLNALTMGAILAIVVALVGVAVGYYQFAYENKITDKYKLEQNAINTLVNTKIKEIQDKEKKCLNNSQNFYQYKQCKNLFNLSD